MSTSSHEPIAIIGAGCRFPGGIASLAQFWEALSARIDAICDIPAERWNVARFQSDTKAARGKMYVRQGGFLQQRLDEMDAGFFGISPREAEALDPQQRLLLEVAWEAMENAGLDVRALAGSRTGVFIGGFTLDHMLGQMGAASRDQIGQHTAVGSTMTMLSNRLSHAFDFRGPSITMDTACSSSLVALHQACQALWSGQCNAALAGGVNVMLRPEMPIAMCKGGFLAPDSHCKSFDARADGYARGEGAGIIVLKRLSDALRDADPILAVVRGIGVNQDGRTNGITVPNGASQEALMREVCAAAGVVPRDVAYVEAHGTGTPVGDPIEARAIGAVYGADRAAPCILGSVKSNIGHLEAASGIAGVMKSVLCLMHNAVPPLGTLQTPNPAIPFGQLGLRLADQMLPLGEPGQAAVVGLNSFGYGGTNAHVLLGSAPVRPDAARAARPDPSPATLPMLPLSAESDTGLRALAQSYADLLETVGDAALPDVLHSATVRRSHLTARLAVMGGDRQTLLNRLRAFLDGTADAGVHVGKAPAHPGRGTVFVFTGMGPQWWAMGQELYRSEPVYRAAADAIDAVFREVAGFSILAEMLRDEAASRIAETQFAQPANFLLQVALTRLLAAAGIVPDAIVGHSVGEVSAAHVAGVLTLREAALVSYHRSRLQKTMAGTGEMLAVGVSEAVVAPLLEHFAGLVSIAAINSPSSVTLAGDAAALAELAAAFKAEGVFHKRLEVEVPYHSPMMDGLRDELLRSLAELRPAAPTLPLYSTVTGARVTGIAYDAAYWFANVRQPVFFAKAARALLDDGYATFLEVGPHPVLSASLKEIFADAGTEARAIQTLRRAKPEAVNVVAAVVALHMAGARIDWRARCPDGRFVALPNYPWQRERLWTEAPSARADRLDDPGRTLLGRPLVDGGEPATVWQVEFSEHTTPYLPDHRIGDLVVVPGAGYLEMFLQLHRHMIGGDTAVLRQVAFSQALVASGTERTLLTANYDAERRTARLASSAVHAEATFYAHDGATAGTLDLPALRAGLSESVDPAELYADLAARGLNYGPRFQSIVALQRAPGEVLAHIRATAPSAEELLQYRVHPTLLDGCFQALIAAVDMAGAASGFVPVEIGALHLHRDFPENVWCYGRLISASARFVLCDFEVCDADGAIVADIRGLRCQAVTGARSGADPLRLAERGYAYRWSEQPEAAAAGRVGHWLLIAEDAAFAEGVAEAMDGLGVADTLIVAPGTVVTETDGRLVVTQPRHAAPPLHRLVETIDGVVLLHGAELGPDTPDPVGLAAAERVLATLQSLSRLQTIAPRTYVVTRGAQGVADAAVNPAAATLLGMTRVAFNELVALRCTSIDLPAMPGADDAVMLAAELVGDHLADEVALRPSGRLVSELARTDRLATPELVQTETAAGAFVLADMPRRDGEPVFDQLQPPVPGDGEILVRVQAAAGSRSFLQAHEAERDTQRPETLICGAVLQGALPAGTRVCGFAAGPLASHVRLRAADVLPVAGPDSAALVATLGLQGRAMLAVRHARIGRGSVVLAHADVAGLAVIQAAKARGATVIAVAATDQPLAFGADRVVATADAIAAAVAALTGGAGVAVLAAPLATWSRTFDLSALAPGGCLLDTDAEPTPRHWPHGAAVGAVLTLAGAAAPQQRRALLAGMAHAARLLQAGTFRALPHTTVAAAGITLADPDRVVVFDRAGATIDARRLQTLLIGPDKTYVVTGGFGGFGVELARWLVRNGARHLALFGRRGAADAQARALVRELQQAGAQVAAIACDIADAADLRSAFAELAASMPPVRGVFHSAAILADAPLADLRPEALHQVMRPKAMGAWNLHEATAGLELDMFVLFSSIAGLVGNSGQTNYAAANCYLDALAGYRRGLGLAGVSVAWGAIADVGLVSRSATLQKHLEYTGLAGMKVADALAALGRILTLDVAQIAYAEADWQQWSRHEPTGGRSPRFAGLVGAAGSDADGSAQDRFREQLAELPPEQRRTVLACTLAEIFGPELRIAAEELDIHRSFNRLGVDSLMAVALQLGMEAAIGVRLSAFDLVGDGTLHELAGKCLAQLDVPDVPLAAAA